MTPNTPSVGDTYGTRARRLLRAIAYYWGLVCCRQVGHDRYCLCGEPDTCPTCRGTGLVTITDPIRKEGSK